MSETKICSKCGESKTLSNFFKDRSKKDGLGSACKQCHRLWAAEYRKNNATYVKAKQAEYQLKNKDEIKEKKKKYNEQNAEIVSRRKKQYCLENANNVKAKQAEYRLKNKDILKEKRKEHYLKNSETINAKRRENRLENTTKIKQNGCLLENAEAINTKQKEYRLKNVDKIKIQRAAYRAREKEKPQHALVKNMRSRLYVALKRTGSKKCANTMELLGCDVDKLRSHLESQFTDGMSWSTYGANGWSCDHVRPIASFDLADEAQQKLAFHYTNLQPLWAADNMCKGSKYPYTLTEE